MAKPNPFAKFEKAKSDKKETGKEGGKKEMAMDKKQMKMPMKKSKC